MDKNLPQSVSPDKGRFRIFVKISLKNFLIDIKKMKVAQKRGGDKIQIAVENIQDKVADPRSSRDDEALFDREWASNVINLRVKSLKKRLAGQKKEIYFKVYEMYELKSQGQDASYDVIAEKLKITVSDVDDEFNYLISRLISFRVSYLFGTVSLLATLKSLKTFH